MGEDRRLDADGGGAPDGSGAAAALAGVGDQLSEEQRRRLAPPSPIHAEVNRIADQLGASVTGDFGFNVASESDDFTVQNLVVIDCLD